MTLKNGVLIASKRIHVQSRPIQLNKTGESNTNMVSGFDSSVELEYSWYGSPFLSRVYGL